MSLRHYGDIALRNQGLLELFESSANGSSKVSLRAPAALAADFTLTLPSAQASANDVITSDGSGNLSFAKIANANVDAAAAIAYSKLALTASIVDADIAALAAIAYSKLALSNSIVNADIAAAAAIAYSKLNLSASIVNADIATAAAIDASKIADGSVSSTEFQYLANVTSDIQTQLNAKVAKAGDTMTGNLNLDNQSQLRLSELDVNGSEYIALRAPAAVTTTVTYTLPEAPAANGYVLASQTDGTMSWVSNASTASFSTDWVTGDTATKTVTHSLGTKDVLVQVYDKTDDSTIYVDSVVRTNTNTVTLTASEAPGASGWRVVIIAA